MFFCKQQFKKGYKQICLHYYFFFFLIWVIKAKAHNRALP